MGLFIRRLLIRPWLGSGGGADGVGAGAGGVVVVGSDGGFGVRLSEAGYVIQDSASCVMVMFTAPGDGRDGLGVRQFVMDINSPLPST